VKRGKEALEEEDFLEAVEQLRAAAKLYPGDGDALLLLGIAEKKAGIEPTDDEAKAKAELEKKKKEAAAAKSGDAAKKAKEEKDAKRETEEQTAAKKEKAAFDNAMKAGQTAFKQKSYAQALDSFQSALDLRSTDAEARRWLELAKRAKEAADAGEASKPAGTASAATKPTASAPSRR
jgi:tetratricopeptide (TPR) repeat protein